MTAGNADQLEFHALGRRAVVGKFDWGNISPDGDGRLPGEVEARTRIVERLAVQFVDHRDPEAIEHSERVRLSLTRSGNPPALPGDCYSGTTMASNRTHPHSSRA